MKKICYIVSDIDKALAFEWIAAHLDQSKVALFFIILNRKQSVLESFLLDKGIHTFRLDCRQGWKMLYSLPKLIIALHKLKPNVIHCHMRNATILGLVSGYILRIKKRVFTRHHAASNHIYFKHAVKQDKVLTAVSTDVVSISDVVSDVLIEWEGASQSKVHKIPHGFDLAIFENVAQKRIQTLRMKYVPNAEGPIVGIISRYLELKGIEYTIEAFIKFRKLNPKAHLILANATGAHSSTIKNKLSVIPEEAYTEITFEQDIPALYKLFDIYVHVPIAKHLEAFGQTYVEALASGVPSIFTLSGIACEFIKHEYNALVVDYKNSDAIFEAMIRLSSDPELRTNLIQNGKTSVRQFDLPCFISKLEKLYE